jgi:predicted  nucleic acid-binding Zn-ribbon protein
LRFLHFLLTIFCIFKNIFLADIEERLTKRLREKDAAALRRERESSALSEKRERGAIEAARDEGRRAAEKAERRADDLERRLHRAERELLDAQAQVQAHAQTRAVGSNGSEMEALLARLLESTVATAPDAREARAAEERLRELRREFLSHREHEAILAARDEAHAAKLEAAEATQLAGRAAAVARALEEERSLNDERSETLRREADAHRTRADESQAQLRAAEAQCAALKTERDRLVERLASDASSLAGASAALDALESQSASIGEQLSQSLKSSERTEAQLADARDECDRLRADVATAREALGKAEAENGSLARQSEALMQEMEAQSALVDALRADTADLGAKLDEQRKLALEGARADADRAHFEAEAERLAADCKRLRAECQGLSEERSRLEGEGTRAAERAVRAEDDARRFKAARDAERATSERWRQAAAEAERARRRERGRAESALSTMTSNALLGTAGSSIPGTMGGQGQGGTTKAAAARGGSSGGGGGGGGRTKSAAMAAVRRLPLPEDVPDSALRSLVERQSQLVVALADEALEEREAAAAAHAQLTEVTSSLRAHARALPALAETVARLLLFARSSLIPLELSGDNYDGDGGDGGDSFNDSDHPARLNRSSTSSLTSSSTGSDGADPIAAISDLVTSEAALVSPTRLVAVVSEVETTLLAAAGAEPGARARAELVAGLARIRRAAERSSANNDGSNSNSNSNGNGNGNGNGNNSSYHNSSYHTSSSGYSTAGPRGVTMVDSMWAGTPNGSFDARDTSLGNDLDASRRLHKLTLEHHSLALTQTVAASELNRLRGRFRAARGALEKVNAALGSAVGTVAALVAAAERSAIARPGTEAPIDVALRSLRSTHSAAKVAAVSFGGGYSGILSSDDDDDEGEDSDSDDRGDSDDDDNENSVTAQVNTAGQRVAECRIVFNALADNALLASIRGGRNPALEAAKSAKLAERRGRTLDALRATLPPAFASLRSTASTLALDVRAQASQLNALFAECGRRLGAAADAAAVEESARRTLDLSAQQAAQDTLGKLGEEREALLAERQRIEAERREIAQAQLTVRAERDDLRHEREAAASQARRDSEALRDREVNVQRVLAGAGAGNTEDLRARAFLEQILGAVESEIGVGSQVQRALRALGEGESGADRMAQEVHLFARELRNALGNQHVSGPLDRTVDDVDRIRAEADARVRELVETRRALAVKDSELRSLQSILERSMGTLPLDDIEQSSRLSARTWELTHHGQQQHQQQQQQQLQGHVHGGPGLGSTGLGIGHLGHFGAHEDSLPSARTRI